MRIKEIERRTKIFSLIFVNVKLKKRILYEFGSVYMYPQPWWEPTSVHSTFAASWSDTPGALEAPYAVDKSPYLRMRQKNVGKIFHGEPFYSTLFHQSLRDSAIFGYIWSLYIIWVEKVYIFSIQNVKLKNLVSNPLCSIWRRLLRLARKNFTNPAILQPLTDPNLNSPFKTFGWIGGSRWISNLTPFSLIRISFLIL